MAQIFSSERQAASRKVAVGGVSVRQSPAEQTLKGLQDRADSSATTEKLAQLRAIESGGPVQMIEEEELLQGKAKGADGLTLQRVEEEEALQGKAKSPGGMPKQLQGSMEAMSGVDMSGVQVHYNSSSPAGVGAHAYAQGSDIHLASGQEQHLPHEAWHVVQQAQGRVQPTTDIGGAQVNDDAGLEREADVMGARAAQMKAKGKSGSRQ